MAEALAKTDMRLPWGRFGPTQAAIMTAPTPIRASKACSEAVAASIRRMWSIGQPTSGCEYLLGMLKRDANAANKRRKSFIDRGRRAAPYLLQRNQMLCRWHNPDRR